MAGTAIGVTTFVLGREQDGHREIRTFENGQAYDLSIDLVQAYTANDTEFPYTAQNDR